MMTRSCHPYSTRFSSCSSRRNQFLLCILGVATIAIGGNCHDNHQKVLDLNENFLQVKDEGLWFVELYAPWCAHCKRLLPIWEQVGHSLADAQSQVRVAKLDCTRFPSVASTLDVHGYPTIIFFRHGTQYRYEGERKKEALIDYAIKISGPMVDFINDPGDLIKPFFVYFHEDDCATSSHLDEYKHLASQFFQSTRFYMSPITNLPTQITPTSSPVVVVFKDDTHFLFDANKDGNLSDWMRAERWPLMPQVSHGNIHEMGDCCGRFLVLAVLDLVERKNLSSHIGQFNAMMREAALSVRDTDALHGVFQFGWMDGSEMANSITMGAITAPGNKLTIAYEGKTFTVSVCTLIEN